MPALSASVSDPTLAPRPATLPGWLGLQARRHSRAVALRHKHLGVWRERSWQQLHDEVGGLATRLTAGGFGAGSTLVVLSHPRPEPLLLALAAQWLGGSAALLDPAVTDTALSAIVAGLRPTVVFAEGAEELKRIRHAGLEPALLLYADRRGLTGEPRAAGSPACRLHHYAEVVAAAEAGALLPPLATSSTDTAFRFFRADDSGVARQDVSHAELLHAGDTLIAAEKLDATEEALAARAFAAGGQARYLLAPWLIAGFRLNFPESLATRDNDRRELGPTLVAGTAATYGRVAALVQTRLPVAGSRQRRLVDWALAPASGRIRRLLGHWLVKRPLRDVIGFTRTRAPLLVGEPLPQPTADFYAALDIRIRAWPDAAVWQAQPPTATPAATDIPLPQGA